MGTSPAGRLPPRPQHAVSGKRASSPSSIGRTSRNHHLSQEKSITIPSLPAFVFLTLYSDRRKRSIAPSATRGTESRTSDRRQRISSPVSRSAVFRRLPGGGKCGRPVPDRPAAPSLRSQPPTFHLESSCVPLSRRQRQAAPRGTGQRLHQKTSSHMRRGRILGCFRCGRSLQRCFFQHGNGSFLRKQRAKKATPGRDNGVLRKKRRGIKT